MNKYINRKQGMKLQENSDSWKCRNSWTSAEYKGEYNVTAIIFVPAVVCSLYKGMMKEKS